MGDNLGTVTISLDFELAWGFADKDGLADEFISEDRRVETEYLNELLDCCDKFDIPLTFATVGHLFLDSCSGSHGGPSANLAADPGTGVTDDPRFYAPDMIASIRDADTAHEIGTHTFSHVLCDSAPRKAVERELQLAAEIHDENGISPPRSFVAPRNRLPELDVLRENGIETVRTAHPTPAETEFEKYVQRLEAWATGALPVFETRTTDGVVQTCSTPFPSLTAVHLPNGQADPIAPFRTVPVSTRQSFHESYLLRALDTAAENGTDLHLWTHVYNLSNSAQWPPIRSFLSTLGSYRDDGRIRVETMSG